MKCDNELLQAWLDGELEDEKADKLSKHLAGCRNCRQELARLKLLWLELSQEEQIEIPPELPYLRQQVIAKSTASRGKSNTGVKTNFWETQKLAWQPLGLAVSYMPVTGGIKKLAKAAGRELPDVLIGSLLALGSLSRRKLFKKGNGSR